MNNIRTIVFIIVLLAIGYFLLPYVKLNSNTAQTNQDNNSDSASVVKTFSSDTLAAKFNYSSDQDGDGKVDTDVKEVGDKVYVYYTASAAEQGQFVQKFSKDPAVSLADAVKKQFLTNIPQTDCFVKNMAEFYAQYGATAPTSPANVERVIIAYPFPADNTQPFDQNAGKCPAGYSLSNGLNYFQMDKNHPDKYYFFSIGQYALFANAAGDTTWQDTFEVTK